jgi:hypothetical protein
LSQNNEKYTGLTLTLRQTAANPKTVARTDEMNAVVYRDADLLMLAGEK